MCSLCFSLTITEWGCLVCVLVRFSPSDDVWCMFQSACHRVMILVHVSTWLSLIDDVYCMFQTLTPHQSTMGLTGLTTLRTSCSMKTPSWVSSYIARPHPSLLPAHLLVPIWSCGDPIQTCRLCLVPLNQSTTAAWPPYPGPTPHLLQLPVNLERPPQNPTHLSPFLSPSLTTLKKTWPPSPPPLHHHLMSKQELQWTFIHLPHLDDKWRRFHLLHQSVQPFCPSGSAQCWFAAEWTVTS